MDEQTQNETVAETNLETVLPPEPPKPLSPEEQDALEKRRQLALKMHEFFAENEYSQMFIDASVITALINERFNELSKTLKISELPAGKTNKKLEDFLALFPDEPVSEVSSLLDALARATQMYIDQRNEGVKIKDLPFKLTQ